MVLKYGNTVKTLFYLILIVSAVATMVQESRGANYYFSAEQGDDARSFAAAQDPNTPWKSIDKLNEIFISLKPGDRVLFRRGETFFGSINVTQSGQAGNPIVIGAYEKGEKPVITSMMEVKNWETKGNHLYEAHVEDISGDLSVLTIAGTPYALGRYPNRSEENAVYLTIDSHNGENMVSTNNLQAPSNFTGGEIVIRKNNWIIDRHRITSHSATSFQYDTEGSDYKPQNGYGFFIQNHPGTLDEMGEWYYDKSNKKLLLYYPNGSPSEAQINVATKDLLVNIRPHISYIEIKELAFEGSNQNSIELEISDNISISDCEIRYSGKNAVNTIASSHFTLKNSIIQHSYNGGVFLQWKDNNAIISNNLFDQTFMFSGMGRSNNGNGIAIYMDGSSHNGLIEFNKITNTGYIGINFNGNNTIVKNNLLDTFCILKDDGAGIYTWTGPPKTKNTNRKVIDNIILNGLGANKGTNNSNTLDKGAAEGIYIDDNATGVEISGNSVANMANSGIYIHNANDIKIYNNRVYNAKQSLWMVHDNLGEPIRNLLVNGNRFLAKYRNQKLIRINSKANDVPEMGQFESNVYAHPLNQIDPITVHLKNASGEVIWKEIDLGSWKEKFQQDLNSKNGPLSFPNFEIKSIIGANKVQNGDFEAPLNDPYCYSPDNNCNIQIEEKDDLESKALKVNLPSRGIVAFSIGAVTKGKAYHFTFSGIGEENGLVKTYLRQSQSPYQIISDTHTLKVSPNKSEVSILFTNQVNEENAVIILKTMDAQNSFWLDNLVLQEVGAQMTDPEAYFLFEYNDSAQPKVISLPGTYVDLDNNLFSGTITLDPFSSVILIKKSDETVPEPISKIDWLSPEPHSNILEGQVVDPEHARISIYPNPATNFVTLEVREGGEPVGKISIFDLEGRLVQTHVPGDQVPGRRFEVPVHQLAAGIYFVTTITDSGAGEMQRLIVIQ
ncbi:MAG: right-handed parallel beta-helix repeat-containing protein [Cyclobacteriaceae bacterium]